ncbi:putative dimethylaniline monooxygenase [Fusarium avenaceum]|nr:putative dimethylaniline monooxygenase [Fusarium avenaceum]
MAQPSRRVAVIGAGPAGAIATDALVKEQAFDTIRVFDRQQVAGGTWVLTRGGNKRPVIPSLSDLVGGRADKPVQIPPSFPCETPNTPEVNSQQLRYSDTAAHEHLHSNLPPSVMAFTQEPIPEIVPKKVLPQYGPIPVFRHREVIRNWVEDIFSKNQNRNLIEFNTSVELAEKVGDEWVLTLRKERPETNSNYWWQERFDALIVASGHYHLPSIPDIPGLIEYGERFPGRIKHTKHYDTADEFKGKRVVVVGGSVSAFDALHDVKRTAKLPIIASLRRPSAIFGSAPFEHPHIKQRPSISSFDPVTGRISFSDGTFEDDIDIVLFATGFEFSFSFLPGIKPVNKRIPGLYQHLFKSDDPSLAFIGMVTGGFGLRIFEWQAVAAARHFAGRANLPPLKQMVEWEQQRVEEKGDGPAFWTLLPDFEKHYEALRAIAGDPAPGTTGRVLPKYDEKWSESFWELINARIAWWREEARSAEKKSNGRVLESSKLA